MAESKQGFSQRAYESTQEAIRAGDLSRAYGRLRLLSNPKAAKRLRRMKKRVRERIVRMRELESKAVSQVKIAWSFQEAVFRELEKKFNIDVRVKRTYVDPATVKVQWPKKEITPAKLRGARHFLERKCKEFEPIQEEGILLGEKLNEIEKDPVSQPTLRRVIRRIRDEFNVYPPHLLYEVWDRIDAKERQTPLKPDEN